MAQGAILVTGGTGVLGGALVQALCAAGWTVFANYAHEDERAQLLQQSCGCQLLCADVSDENALETAFATLPPLFGVVHLAGITRDALLLRQSPESWGDTLRVNVTGSFLVTRAALRKLENGGRLILAASRVGERGAIGQGAYAASKAAIIALMQCAARESAGRLQVNAICPPFVPSELAANVSSTGLAHLAAQSLSGQFGSASSFAGAVHWLLGAGGEGVSGQVIHCDDRMF